MNYITSKTESKDYDKLHEYLVNIFCLRIINYYQLLKISREFDEAIGYTLDIYKYINTEVQKCDVCNYKSIESMQLDYELPLTGANLKDIVDVINSKDLTGFREEQLMKEK